MMIISIPTKITTIIITANSTQKLQTPAKSERREREGE